MQQDTPTREDVHNWVQDYYGSVLAKSEDLKTNACCATGAPSERITRLLSNVHPDVIARFYGCGFPIPEAVEGCTVVDLGCGTGRDVYLMAQLVGENGTVHGVDMTPSQLEVAKRTANWHRERFGYAESNVHFHQGYIEDLSMIEDASVDVVISNCVVNLSPRKDLVMQEIFRILKPGGEFYFSDVFCDRRLPAEIANDPLLHSECLGGAMYDFDFEQLSKRTGFLDPRAINRAPIAIQSDEIEQRVGDAKFSSITVRLFKLAELEPRCEDYGQTATYISPIPGHEDGFWLDDHHLFEPNRTEKVCSNTAAMLASTRLAKHFRVDGDTTVHYGAFDCSATDAASESACRPSSSGPSCC